MRDEPDMYPATFKFIWGQGNLRDKEHYWGQLLTLRYFAYRYMIAVKTVLSEFFVGEANNTFGGQLSQPHPTSMATCP